MTEPEEKKEESLTIRNQDLGKAILSEAQTKYDDLRKQRVLQLVQSIMSERDAAQLAEIRFHKAALRCQSKLDALNAGEFELDRLTGRLTFKDGSLNEPVERDAHGNPIW
jgi:hypothetical protein